QFTYNMKKLIISSIVTGIILTITGLWISYLLDLASGATIILLLALVFLLSFFIKKAVMAVRRLKT
ncbi:MAG: metal ABC transporter permease, partial [Actinobacteria bacterium]|nr:metal ABC transporter permease [Actinomycetota bacterium]